MIFHRFLFILDGSFAFDIHCSIILHKLNLTDFRALRKLFRMMYMYMYSALGEFVKFAKPH